MRDGDREFLDQAIEQARLGYDEGGIPIGAVLVHDGRALAAGRNRRVQQGSATLHGEIDALERAGRLPARVYREATLYTTLSPCLMCAGAALLYEIPRIVVGENRTFAQSEELLTSRGVDVVIIDDVECRRLMTTFVEEHPQVWNEDIGVE